MQFEFLRRRARRRPHRRGPGRPSLDWRSPAQHLWVATRDGEYAGMTELTRARRFVALSRTAEPLGTFESLDQAMAALESES